MKKFIDECVGCPSEMGCLGEACPFVGSIEVCDICEMEQATCRIDNLHYCDECAKELLQGEFDNLDFSERAEILGFDFEYLRRY